jgi:hypothetical protein
MADPFRVVRRCAPLAVLALALATLRADDAKPAPKAPPGRAIDPSKLPPNAVIIVSDNPRDALENVNAVVLSPDEYKKLLDAAEKAKRLVAPDKPEPPSVCRLSGRVEARGAQEIAALRAEFQFRTTAPRATILLGLQKGKPVAATIDDGKLAVLVPLAEGDGFAVLVDSVGEHRVAVDLEVPLASRGSKGGERGVELGLPGAAITAIERLEMPAGVTKVRLAGRTLTTRQLAGGTERAPAALLGPTAKLDLAWDAPTATGKMDSQTSVDGRYDVRVEDRALVTRARLTLKPQAGPVGRWELTAPPTADVILDAANGADTTVRIDKPRDKTKPWIVRRDPSGDDLVLDVSCRTDLIVGKSIAVPVFAIAAAPQRGTISLGGPSHLRLTFKPAANVVRREAADDVGHEAVFAFTQLPDAGTLLEIDVQAARGEVETQISHQLALTERGWRWQGKFDVRPVRTEVTSIDLEVPAELQELRATSAEVVEGLTARPDSAGPRKVMRVQLAEGRRRTFTFTLEGLYPTNPTATAASLLLPRLLGTLDRGGPITAVAPAGLELRGSYRDWEGDRAGNWERPLDTALRGATGLSATAERTAARVDLAWRAPRADVLLTAAADIQLGERQATVRHQWHVPAGPAAPRQFAVRGPAALAGRLRALEGGTLTPTSPGEWSIQLTSPAGRDATITLAYSFPLPSTPDRSDVTVPLVWFEPCRCETDVRIWSAVTPNGVLSPALVDGPWAEVPVRAVADRPTLPNLALHGSGPHLPLTLRLNETAAGPGVGLVVERIWVQAIIDTDGQQAYRTRCLIRPEQTHFLDVELPAAPATIQFAAALDGKRLPWTTVEVGKRFVRLRLDPAENTRESQQLELVYLLPPQNDSSRWHLTLSPPRLRGPVFIGPVRWQIAEASADMLLGNDESIEFEWRWAWHRGLFTPKPAWSAADLRRWFGADARSAASEPVDDFGVALVGSQPTMQPLSFVVVSRSVALLVGSFVVLAFGLAAVRVKTGWRVAGTVALAIALTWLAVVRPQLLAMFLYVAQPGAAVLVAVLLARWLIQRRFRRRVLFLPGFTRPSTAESSLVRNGPLSRVQREPSTIDAPTSRPGAPAGY